MSQFLGRTGVLAIATCLFFTPALGEDSSSEIGSLNQEAATKVGALMKGLQAELGAAIKEGGFVNAIEVCKTVAPSIAAQVSDQGGMSVRRTALKLRNPDNAPDDYERKILEQFVADLEAGKDPKEVGHSEIVDVNGTKVFRFLKAIPTGALCLNCHGNNLKDDVKAQIEKLYPHDEATGFKAGDLRGAFSVSKKL